MALKLNLAVNYLSQIYNGLIGILVMPVYLACLGSEAYGLIAFFTLLQSWFYLLDAGLSQTLVRETVRYKSGQLQAASYQKVYRTIHLIFLGLSMAAVAVLLLLSQQIAHSWLKISALALDDVSSCLQIMFVSIGLRCLGGIYRGVLQGFEKIVWLSSFNIIINTLRFIAVLPVMYFTEYSISVFFKYQLLVAVLEFAALLFTHLRLLKAAQITSDKNQAAETGYLEKVIKFALFSGASSMLWVFVSQSDKMLLSGILPLTEYGYFSIAVLLASVIYMVSTPVSNVILPRLTALHAEQQISQLNRTYRQVAQFVAVLAASIAATVFWNAESIIALWSGNPQLSPHVADILRLYMLGNAFLVLNAFTYYIQYAFGQIKYHFWGNVLLVSLMLPAMYYAAQHYGGIGAAYVWVSLHALWFFSWTILINRKFLEQPLRWTWSVSSILLGSFAFSYLLHKGSFWLQPLLVNKALHLVQLAAFGGLVLLCALCFLEAFREKVKIWLKLGH